MMFKLALAFVFLGCVFGRQYKIVAESEVDAQERKDRVAFPGYFDQSWREIYNKNQLIVQPKWKVVEKKTVNKRYEVREYDEAWFASAHTPCLNQSESAADGYVRLYIYMDISNRKHPYQYPLTYPILSKVELGAESIERRTERREDIVHVQENNEERVTQNRHVTDVPRTTTQQTPKHKIPMVDVKDSRKSCPDRFTQIFYLPIAPVRTPAQSKDDSILIEKVPKRKYYVRRYADEFTHQSQTNCNLQAGMLARTLALSRVQFNPRSYYCAMYEPGTSDVTAHFEVWFEAKNEM